MPYCIATDKATVSLYDGGSLTFFKRKDGDVSSVIEDKVRIRWTDEGQHYFRTVDGWSANHADASVVNSKEYAEGFAFELAMEQPPFMGHLHVLEVVWKPISREFEIRDGKLFVSKAEKTKEKPNE